MKKLILILVLLLPLAAFARFEALVTDVDTLFGKISGYVVSTDGDTVYTDLGRDKGVFPGMELKVYRENEPIIHPITGQVLGNKKIYIGDLKITDVQDKFSTGKLSVQQREPKQGDLIVLNPPVEVSVSVKNLPPRLETLLRQEISGAQNILIKDKARLSLVFTQKQEGGIQYAVTDTASGKTIYSKYFADQDKEVEQTSNAAKDIVTSDPIGKPYKSMAVGHLKNDGKMYIAMATNKEIDLFTFDGKKFAPAGSLGVKLRDIQNIEAADLNGNGTDELFVTMVVDDYTIQSSAYEYDGKQFVQKATGIPYILRTIYVKGQKKIASQRLGQDGNYLGFIQEFVWRDGQYERGATLSNARDLSIYGFGLSDMDNDGKDEVFDINSDYKIDVYNGTDKKYTSAEEFGQTPYYFNITQEVKQEFKTTDEGNDPFTTEKNKKYIKGRIFVNSDGNVYVVKNSEKYKMLNQMKVYGTSSFSIFSWDGRRLRPKWESDVFQPVIVDYFMYEEYGRTYMFLLRNFSEGILSDDKSELIYIETK